MRELSTKLFTARVLYHASNQSGAGHGNQFGDLLFNMQKKQARQIRKVDLIIRGGFHG